MKASCKALLLFLAVWLVMVGAGYWFGLDRAYAQSGSCGDCATCAQYTQYYSGGAGMSITFTLQGTTQNYYPQAFDGLSGCATKSLDLYYVTAQCFDSAGSSAANPPVILSSWTFDNATPACTIGSPPSSYIQEITDGIGQALLSNNVTQYTCDGSCS